MEIAVKFKQLSEYTSNLLDQIVITEDEPTSRVSAGDKIMLLRNSIFVLWIVLARKLIIGEELYLTMGNGRMQLTRRWMEGLLGREFTDYAFQFLHNLIDSGLSDREMALFVPCVLTLSTPREISYDL
jgi:hypothetical protein